MNTVVSNHNQATYYPLAVSLYENGHFSSKVESNTANVSYASFQTLSKTNNLFFKVGFSDFDYKFKLGITDLESSLDSNEIIFYLSLDNQLTFRLVLEGYWTQDKEPQFQHKSSNWNLHQKQETPVSNFLLSTFWAMMNLSENVKINLPDVNYSFTSSYNLPLNEINQILQERQIAYRLLVIENALGISLPFPNGFISGEDIESIAFCYHAIVDREFDWFANPTIIPWESSKESFSWLPEKNEPTPITFKPSPVIKYIFGVGINLGVLAAKLDNAVIENYDEVKENLSKLNGRIVEVKLRSISGVSRMIALQVPSLPPNPWTPELQKLIDLDSQLDSISLERFFNLAFATLEGLTEEQKKAITKRPELDEEAFNF